MYEKINLKPVDYYNQRNNEYDDPATPQHERWSACMAEVAAMFYDGNGIKIINPSIWKNGDYFMSLFRTPEAWGFARQKYGWLITQGFKPNEIHGMYHSYLEPLVCGRRVSDFIEGMTWDKFNRLVEKSRVIFTSGTFKDWGISGDGGHAQAIIGREANGDLSIGDPYGNPWTYYQNWNGYRVPFTREQVEKYIHPWGHVLLEDVKDVT